MSQETPRSGSELALFPKEIKQILSVCITLRKGAGSCHSPAWARVSPRHMPPTFLLCFFLSAGLHFPASPAVRHGCELSPGEWKGGTSLWTHPHPPKPKSHALPLTG